MKKISEKGVSIIEAMVATAIIGIGFVAIFQMVQYSVRSINVSGMSYIMEYTKKINPNDEVIEDKGVKVFIDSAAVMYLLGTEMDYKKNDFSSSFIFNNPNETERCGCGESFKV